MSSNNDEKLNQLIERDKKAKKNPFYRVYSYQYIYAACWRIFPLHIYRTNCREFCFI